MSSSDRRRLRAVIGNSMLGFQTRKVGDLSRASFVSQLADNQLIIDQLNKTLDLVEESCPTCDNPYTNDPALGHLWYVLKYYDKAASEKKGAVNALLEAIFASAPFKMLKSSRQSIELKIRKKFDLHKKVKFVEPKPLHGGQSYIGQPTPSDTGQRREVQHGGASLIPSNLSQEQAKGDLTAPSHPDALMDNKGIPEVVSIHQKMPGDLSSAKPDSSLLYSQSVAPRSALQDQAEMESQPSTATPGYRTEGKLNFDEDSGMSQTTFNKEELYRKTRTEGALEAVIGMELGATEGSNFTRAGQQALNTTNYQQTQQGTGSVTTMGASPNIFTQPAEPLTYIPSSAEKAAEKSMQNSQYGAQRKRNFQGHGGKPYQAPPKNEGSFQAIQNTTTEIKMPEFTWDEVMKVFGKAYESENPDLSAEGLAKAAAGGSLDLGRPAWERYLDLANQSLSAYSPEFSSYVNRKATAAKDTFFKTAEKIPKPARDLIQAGMDTFLRSYVPKRYPALGGASRIGADVLDRAAASIGNAPQSGGAEQEEKAGGERKARGMHMMGPDFGENPIGRRLLQVGGDNQSLVDPDNPPANDHPIVEPEMSDVKTLSEWLYLFFETQHNIYPARFESWRGISATLDEGLRRWTIGTHGLPREQKEFKISPDEFRFLLPFIPNERHKLKFMNEGYLRTVAHAEGRAEPIGSEVAVPLGGGSLKRKAHPPESKLDELRRRLPKYMKDRHRYGVDHAGRKRTQDERVGHESTEDREARLARLRHRREARHNALERLRAEVEAAAGQLEVFRQNEIRHEIVNLVEEEMQDANELQNQENRLVEVKRSLRPEVSVIAGRPDSEHYARYQEGRIRINSEVALAGQDLARWHQEIQQDSGIFNRVLELIRERDAPLVEPAAIAHEGTVALPDSSMVEAIVPPYPVIPDAQAAPDQGGVVEVVGAPRERKGQVVERSPQPPPSPVPDRPNEARVIPRDDPRWRLATEGTVSRSAVPDSLVARPISRPVPDAPGHEARPDINMILGEADPLPLPFGRPFRRRRKDKKRRDTEPPQPDRTREAVPSQPMDLGRIPGEPAAPERKGPEEKEVKMFEPHLREVEEGEGSGGGDEKQQAEQRASGTTGEQKEAYMPLLRLSFAEGNANIVMRINEDPKTKEIARLQWQSFNGYDKEANTENDNPLYIQNILDEHRRFYDPLDKDELLPSQAASALKESYDNDLSTCYFIPPEVQEDGQCLLLDTRGGGPLMPLSADDTDAAFHDVYLPTWAEIPEDSGWKQFTQVEGSQMPDTYLEDESRISGNDWPMLSMENGFIYSTLA